MTLQITPEGVDYLHKHNYVSSDGDFDNKYLQHLRQKKWAFTKGLSPLKKFPKLHFEYSVDKQTNQQVPKAARLIFIETETSWQLELHLNEIPDNWMKDISDLTEALSSWYVRLGDEKISAMKLWPGRGGYKLPVKPTVIPYELILEGEPPPQWDIPTWLSAVDQLSNGFIVFSADDGELIPPGSLLIGGRDYYVIAPSQLKFPNFNFNSSSSSKSKSLVTNHYWNAYQVCFSNALGDQKEMKAIAEWCEKIGYYFINEQCRLMFIAPPVPRYYGKPLRVGQGEKIVFAVELVKAKKKKNVEVEEQKEIVDIEYHCYTCSKPGSVEITVENDGCNILSLEVVPRDKLEYRELQALSLYCIIEGELYEYSAYDGTSIHQLPRLLSGDNPQVQVEIHCDVLIDLFYGNESIPRLQQINAPEAGVELEKLLKEAYQQNEKVSITVDAGAFGRIRLVTQPIVVNLEAGYSNLPPKIVQRARWIASLLQASATNVPSLPIVSAARKQLTMLSKIPGCAIFSSVQQVPIFIAPHVYSLLKSIQQENPKVHQ